MSWASDDYVNHTAKQLVLVLETATPYIHEYNCALISVLTPFRN